ncbi:MAG: TonB-dependent receptor [Ginsengibacter sp.]
MLPRMKVIVLLFALIPAISFGQRDSFETRNVLLKEVIIQNDRYLNYSKEKKQPADLQTSTDQILDAINGVSMIKRGNFALEPTIRGLNAGQINVTIDGMAMFGACTDRMDPISSYIEPNNLQSIMVNFGANDMAYGSSIGGGFDFKIKQPRLNAIKKWSGLAGVGYESNGNAVQTLAAVNYSTEKLGINMNGIFRNSQNYKAAKGEEIKFSQYSKWNGGISAKYQVKDHHFLQFNYIQDEGYNIGYPALTMDVEFAKAKIGALSHIYHQNIGALQHLETKIYYNFIDHAMDDTKRPAEQVPMHMDMPGTSETMGFYSEAKWAFKNHEIKTKINGYQNRLHAEMTMYPENAAEMFMLTIPDAQRNVIGLDISDRIDINSALSVLIGGRMDVSSSSIFTTEGKKLLSGMFEGELSRNTLLYNLYLNPVYQLNSHFSIYANLARTMRQGTLQEMYGFYLFNRMDGYDYLGNPDIANETSWNAALGGQYQKNGLKIELQAYSYFMKNYIAGIQKHEYSVMTIGANGVRQYSNLPSAILSGIEASGEIKISKQVSFSTSNAFNYGTDNEGGALPLISPFKSINQLNYKSDKISVGLTGVISASQNHVNTARFGETSTPAFGLIHLKAGKDIQFKTKTLSFHGGIENLLDKNYVEHLDIMKIPRMGRNLVLHATFHF